MFFYIIIIIICLIPLLFEQNKKALFVSFMLLWVFASLRCDFGDYYAYYDFWHYTQGKSFKDIFPFLKSFSDIFFKRNISDISVEFGYLFLSKIIPGNFVVFISVLTAFYIFTAYNFIIKYVPEKYYYLSFILFVDPIIFLTNLSAVRQTLSLSFLLLFIPFLTEKKYKSFCFGIILATLCHRSAIVFILLPVLYYVLEKKLYSFVVLLLISFVPICMLFVGGGFLSSSGFYSYYTNNDGSGNIIYSIFLIVPALFALYITDKDKIINLFFTLIYSLIIALRIICLIPSGQSVTRYNLYIEEFAIVLFPLIILDIKNIFLKHFFILCCIVFVIARSVLFFATPGRIGENTIDFFKQNIFYPANYIYMRK